MGLSTLAHELRSDQKPLQVTCTELVLTFVRLTEKVIRR